MFWRRQRLNKTYIRMFVWKLMSGNFINEPRRSRVIYGGLQLYLAETKIPQDALMIYEQMYV